MVDVWSILLYIFIFTSLAFIAYKHRVVRILECSMSQRMLLLKMVSMHAYASYDTDT